MDETALWRDTPEVTGGCQCGAVQYRLAAGRTKATICHCRMCQRAMGAPFAAFLETPRTSVEWHGTPARFASSNKAERGFCAACGTPLFFAFHDSASIELTAGSLPRDFPYAPVRQHGIESRHGWINDIAELPALETYSTGVASTQAPENDGA